MKDKLKNQLNSGFTLIELVIVIAILGILVSIAIINYSSTKRMAAIGKHNGNVRILYSAANVYIADSEAPSNDMDAETTKNAIASYIQSWPEPVRGTGTAIDGTAYTVTIDISGDVIVLPPRIEE